MFRALLLRMRESVASHTQNRHEKPSFAYLVKKISVKDPGSYPFSLSLYDERQETLAKERGASVVGLPCEIQSLVNFLNE